MDLYEANKIVLDYANELMKPEFFHSLYLLKHTKERVILSFKICIIHIVKYQTHTREQFDREMAALISLETFINHDDYLKLRTSEPKEILVNSEMEKLFDVHFEKVKRWDSYDEVVDFTNKIIKLDRNEITFFKQAYAYAGIEYKPEYRIAMENANRNYLKK